MFVLAALRMVRTAAHHQVNYQHRDAQDAGQPAIQLPISLLFVIGGKVSLSSAELASSPPGDSYPIRRL